MKYIATREGVEVLTGKGPVTERQTEMVTKLLKDFPDMRDSFEYEDYKQAPTLHTASALISAALDSHMQNLQSENGYLRYIATRPGAEKARRTWSVRSGGKCGFDCGDARLDFTRRQRLDDHLFSASRGRRAAWLQQCRSMAQVARQPAEQVCGSVSYSSVGTALVRSLPRCGYAPAYSHDDLDRSGDGFETGCCCEIALCNDQQHLSGRVGKSLYSKRT